MADYKLTQCTPFWKGIMHLCTPMACQGSALHCGSQMNWAKRVVNMHNIDGMRQVKEYRTELFVMNTWYK